MKKLFTALLCLVGFAAFSQTTGYFRYDSVRFEKVGGNSEFILLNSTRDSIGVLYNIGNGRTIFRTISSLGLSPNVRNGIRKSVDTLMLGDSLDRYTYIQILSHLQNGSRFNHLRLGNLPEAQSLNGIMPLYPNMLTYNPSTFGIERIYSTANGDIDSVFYGGAISTITRILRDSTDAFFGIGKRKEILASQGGEFVFQYFPPRDTLNLHVGRDGQCGSAVHAQFDLGHSYGYNINMTSQNGMPNFPMTQVMTSMDYMRVIDNTRSHKITGVGFGGYVSKYKTYQSAITMSTHEAGNFTENTFGYVAYGDAYPLISEATKAKTLAVWEAKNVYGFYVHPQYRYTNTVNNGYSFFAAGDTDILVNKGFAYFGPSATPVRSPNTESLRYRLHVTGRGRFTDSLISDGIIDGFITRGQALHVALNPSLGTQPSLEFYRSDSLTRQQAVIFVETTGQPANRYLALRIGGNYSDAQNPTQGTGQYIAFETGPNQQFRSRISRNGNWSIGNSAAILAYRWWKKFAVDGGGVFRDTLRLEVAPLQVADDTTNFKIVVRNTTTGDLLTMPWVGGSGGGGGGSGTVNSGTANRLSYYASTGTAVSELAAITANRALISDANGLPTHATTTDTEIGYLNGVTSAIQTQLDNRWSLAGNAAVSGSQTGSFIGTTNSVALRFGTNGSRRMYLDSARNQLILGPATVDANHALIINSLTNTNTHGIRIYYNNNAGSVEIGPGGIEKAGNYDINISSSALSLRGNTGVIIGASAHSTTATAALQVIASTTSKAQLKLISTGALPTSTNIVAGNVDAIGDKIYYTIATGPAQKEFTLNDGALTANTYPVTTTNGRLTNSIFTTSNLLSSSLGNVASVIGVTNIASVSQVTGSYSYNRIGNVVTFTMQFDVDATAAGTLTTFRFMGVPASNFAATTNATGVVTCGTEVLSGTVTANVANDDLEVNFISSSTNQVLITVSGQYTVI